VTPVAAVSPTAGRFMKPVGTLATQPLESLTDTTIADLKEIPA
jgi:hypothetical protein